VSHKTTIRLSLLAAVVLLAAALPTAQASAQRTSLAITSPGKSATVKHRMRIRVRASRAYTRVSFGVDRRTLWVDRDRPFRFRRSGILNVRGLARGRHRLWIEGRRRDGDVRRVSRTFFVQRRARRPRPPAPSNPFGGRVLFRGDFDTGNAEQFRNVQSERGRVTFGAANPSPFEGSHRARFEVRPGDEAASGNRAEVTGPSFEEGSERWIRQAIYVPSGTATERGWRLVMQFHAFGGGSPPLAVFLESGRDLRFEVGHGDSSTFDWRGPRIQRNRWYAIALHVRFSPNPSQGFVEVYFNGRRQRLTNGRTRRYRATSEDGGAYYKTGIYRDDDIDQTDVVFHDNVVISAP
jgi:Polysaccharide lyase